MQSQSFTDASGKSWTIELTVTGLLRIKNATGFQLDDLIPRADHDGKKVGESMEAFANFMSDGMQVFNVVSALIEPQLKAAGLTKEAFGEVMNGESIVGMTLAMGQAVHDFFPMNAVRQALIAKSLSMGKQAMDVASKRLTKELDKIDVESVINAEIDKKIEQDQSSKSASDTAAS